MYIYVCVMFANLSAAAITILDSSNNLMFVKLKIELSTYNPEFYLQQMFK